MRVVVVIAALTRTLRLGAVFALVALPAGAGTVCAPEPVSPQAVSAAARLAIKLRDELERLQPRVAIVARAGADLSKHGLVYSHAGFVLRNHPLGRWRVVHELNHCGTERSELFVEGLINFFTDDPFELRALILVPKLALQRPIERELLQGLGRRLHEPRYNMIANPYSTRYQNSNQWLLEIIVSAESMFLAADNRGDAQRLLRWSKFTPDMIPISGAKQLAANLFRANVRFDDHSEESRRDGRFPVVSVRSIRRYLQASHQLAAMREIN